MLSFLSRFSNLQSSPRTRGNASLRWAALTQLCLLALLVALITLWVLRLFFNTAAPLVTSTALAPSTVNSALVNNVAFNSAFTSPAWLGSGKTLANAPVLLGVIVSLNPSQSTALLSIQADNGATIARVFKVGQIVSEGVVLESVSKEGAVVMMNGAPQSLTLVK